MLRGKMMAVNIYTQNDNTWISHVKSRSYNNKTITKNITIKDYNKGKGEGRIR